jgi:hypothetical protein
MAKLYVLDENNNKIEVTTEVLSAVVQKVLCCVSGIPHSMAFVSQAKLNELITTNNTVNNGVYFITDDTTAEDIEKQLNEHKAALQDIDYKLNELPELIQEFNAPEHKTIENYLTKQYAKIDQIGLYFVEIYNSAASYTENGKGYINGLLYVSKLAEETTAYINEDYTINYKPTNSLGLPNNIICVNDLNHMAGSLTRVIRLKD